ncbi:MAG: 3-phosphoshikimate 1-carboxyvinyltransferase [Egibacteraceae bacterium]
MMPIEVVPSGPVRASLRAPASKSVTNRLLVISALAEGPSLLRHPLDSDDTRAMRAAITALGARVDDAEDGWLVRGTGGRLGARSRSYGYGPGRCRRVRAQAPLGETIDIDARLSGTTMRFAVAMAALAGGPVTVTGAAPLLRRPISPLLAALRALGADVLDGPEVSPVRLGGGGLKGGSVEVDISRSTQFASAILLVAPYAAEGVRIHVTGEGASGYLAMTLEAMARWGVAVDRIGAATWYVAPDQPYRARDETVEHDASAAAHLFALAAATGGEVTVTNAGQPTSQPDAGLPALLERMGCSVVRDQDALTVAGPARLHPLHADLRAMPDQVTTLAALAALAEGTSVLRGVAVARGHETDRLAALAHQLRALGVTVTELPDGLEITGGARGPANLATHDDHRLAMAFAAIGARIPGVVVEDPECVAKTYPQFWSDVAEAGVRWRST